MKKGIIGVRRAEADYKGKQWVTNKIRRKCLMQSCFVNKKLELTVFKQYFVHLFQIQNDKWKKLDEKQISELFTLSLLT